jgi:hypothetical protein
MASTQSSSKEKVSEKGASERETPEPDVNTDVFPNPSDEEPEYPHGLKLALLLFSLCLACFLVALDQTIIATAIPKITDHFKSVQDIGWYGSAYFLTATALQPTFGRIYTIFSVSSSSTILSSPPQPLLQ